MSATFYKNFEIKWGTNCTQCGRGLAPGASAWGYKDGTLGRWRFICDRCHAKVVKESEAVAEPTVTFPDEDAVDGKVSDDFLSMLPESEQIHELKSEPASTAVNMVKEKPLLERLKDEAPWRLA